MTEPQCRHEWIDRTTVQDARTALFCPRCGTYRFDPPVPLPEVPGGDLYYLQEVTPRDEEEDNDGPR